MRKYFIAIISALLILFLSAMPVFAVIADPDAGWGVRSVSAYQNIVETGDQLYIIHFMLEYAVNPTEGTAGELFIVRLLNGGATLAVTAPTTYNNSGYCMGVVGIYFTAASAPAWGGAYSVELVGNPVYDWGGDPPLSTTAAIVWSTSTVATVKEAIATKIRSLGLATQTSWAVAGLDLVINLNGVYQLTPEGEAYFVEAVPNLKFFAPSVFPSITSGVNIQNKSYSGAYDTSLAGKLVGTKWDASTMATQWGLSRMWLTTLMWFFFVGVISIWLCMYKFGTYRPLTIILLFSLPFGWWTGFLTGTVAILSAFCCAAFIIYQTFFKGAY